MTRHLRATSELLRVLVAGSVDDGKSTLIGRLLHDNDSVHDDHLEALRRDSSRIGSAGGALDFALLTDGLKAEREQGITIDVAYRYVSTRHRKLIIADCPGHEQYTRNMATGASRCDLALLLVDASAGITDQTRRHSFIASLMGIRHLIVVVNKMDLLDYQEQAFERLCRDFSGFAARLEAPDVRFLPVSALAGDNVVHKSDKMPWYSGPPLIDLLDQIHVAADRNLIDLRLPIQLVLRPHDGFRGYAGTVASGVLRPGQEVMVLPDRQRTRVVSLRGPDGPLAQAFAPLPVTVELADQLDIGRGSMLVQPNNQPQQSRELELSIVWMDEAPLQIGKRYLIKQTTRWVQGHVSAIRYRFDMASAHREPAEQLALNDIGRVQLTLARPLFWDPYARNHETGSLIVVDPQSNDTVAAGLILDRGLSAMRDDQPADAFDDESTTLLRARQSQVGQAERADRLGHKPGDYLVDRLAALRKDHARPPARTAIVRARHLDPPARRRDAAPGDQRGPRLFTTRSPRTRAPSRLSGQNAGRRGLVA
jgi:bifunctional enzyme CysN/CysC